MTAARPAIESILAELRRRLASNDPLVELPRQTVLDAAEWLENSRKLLAYAECERARDLFGLGEITREEFLAVFARHGYDRKDATLNFTLGLRKAALAGEHRLESGR